MEDAQGPKVDSTNLLGPDVAKIGNDAAQQTLKGAHSGSYSSSPRDFVAGMAHGRHCFRLCSVEGRRLQHHTSADWRCLIVTSSSQKDTTADGGPAMQNTRSFLPHDEKPVCFLPQVGGSYRTLHSQPLFEQPVLERHQKQTQTLLETVPSCPAA